MTDDSIVAETGNIKECSEKKTGNIVLDCCINVLILRGGISTTFMLPNHLSDFKKALIFYGTTITITCVLQATQVFSMYLNLTSLLT